MLTNARTPSPKVSSPRTLGFIDVLTKHVDLHHVVFDFRLPTTYDDASRQLSTYRTLGVVLCKVEHARVVELVVTTWEDALPVLNRVHADAAHNLVIVSSCFRQ